MAFGHVGEAREPRGEVAMLARLHQAEMPLGQKRASASRGIAPRIGNAERRDRLGHEPDDAARCRRG